MKRIPVLALLVITSLAAHVPMAYAADVSLTQAVTNSLGMRFVPVQGTEVLFSVWETRVQDYEAFARSEGRSWKRQGFLQGGEQPVQQKDDEPAVMVSWEDANAFCVWLTAKERAEGKIGERQAYRLPSNAEWTVAVGDDPFPWGKEWPPPKGAGNYGPKLKVDDFIETAPVGSFKANRFGLFDMGGNVWEWIGDVPQPDREVRGIRGGDFSAETPEAMSSRTRSGGMPDSQVQNCGFRCVLGVEVPKPKTPAVVADAIRQLQQSKQKTFAPPSGPVPPPPAAGQPYENGLGMKFVPVPGTAVLFSIWETRVKDFAAFAEHTGYDTGIWMGVFHFQRYGVTSGFNWKQPGFRQGEDHPVVGMNWLDASAFCEWLTLKERAEGRLTESQRYRLPNEAEWSVAVAAEGTYPWGNSWPPTKDAGNYAGEEARDAEWPPQMPIIKGYNDGWPRTAPVGSFKPNRHGLYDMSGNVAEWCADWYRKEMNDPKLREKKSFLDEDGGGQTLRVTRGGSFNNFDPSYLRTDYHGGSKPKERHFGTGFRCVLETSSSPADKP